LCDVLLTVSQSFAPIAVGATTVWTREDWSPTFRLRWTNYIYWFPQLLGRSFYKAKNFTASSRQNAVFSI